MSIGRIWFNRESTSEVSAFDTKNVQVLNDQNYDFKNDFNLIDYFLCNEIIEVNMLLL